MLPEFILLLGICFVLAFGCIFVKSSILGYPQMGRYLAFFSLCVVLCVLYTYIELINVDGRSTLFLCAKNVFVSYSACIVLVCVCLILFALLIRPVRFEYYIFILVGTFGCLIMLGATNLAVFYIALEILGITTYLSLGIEQRSVSEAEGGLRYFILNSFASIVVLFGIVCLYGFCGTMEYDILHNIFALYTTLSNGYVVSIDISLYFILTGLLFKLYSAPMQRWIVDIYAVAPTVSLLFVALVPQITVTLVTLHFFSGYIGVFSGAVGHYSVFMSIIAFVGILYGSIGGLFQSNIKRLLAYSSIVNFSYFLAGICSGDYIVIQQNLVQLLMYLLVLYSILCLLYYTNVDNMGDLRGLYRQNKTFSYLYTFFFFPLAGMPVFNIFFAKIDYAISMYADNAVIFIIFILISTFVTSFFYIRIIKEIYYMPRTEYVFIRGLTYYEQMFLMLLLSIQVYLWIDGTLLYNIVGLLLM